MEQIPASTRKAYDDMFHASAILESAITILDILGGQSLSEQDWSSAAFGIGMILRVANDALDKGQNPSSRTTNDPDKAKKAS